MLKWQKCCEKVLIKLLIKKQAAWTQSKRKKKISWAFCVVLWAIANMLYTEL